MFGCSGDAYTYTLQPVFNSLGQQFRCHIRRRHPDTVYQLWFYITVPGTGFETPRVHSRIAYRPARSGSDRVTPFLTVDYTVGMMLEDELVLIGRVDDDDDSSEDSNKESWNYTVLPLVNQSHAHRSVVMHCNLRLSGVAPVVLKFN